MLYWNSRLKVSPPNFRSSARMQATAGSSRMSATARCRSRSARGDRDRGRTPSAMALQGSGMLGGNLRPDRASQCGLAIGLPSLEQQRSGTPQHTTSPDSRFRRKHAHPELTAVSGHPSGWSSSPFGIACLSFSLQEALLLGHAPKQHHNECAVSFN